MGYLAASGAQTFLTTTDASLVKAAAAADTLWMAVHAGEVAYAPRPDDTPPLPSGEG
jgi:DNA replication and repair protein RecF